MAQKASDFFNEISTEALQNGIYLIEAKDGTFTETKKLIIQK
jgi:hypothetical protein